MVFTQDQLKYMYETKSYHIEPIINVTYDLIGFNKITASYETDDITGHKIFAHYAVFINEKEYIKEIKSY